jgi:hypothetical protein
MKVQEIIVDFTDGAYYAYRPDRPYLPIGEFGPGNPEYGEVYDDVYNNVMDVIGWHGRPTKVTIRDIEV